MSVTPDSVQPPNEVNVRLRRAVFKPTDDQPLRTAIRLSTGHISYKNYERFMDHVMCGEPSEATDGLLRPNEAQSEKARLRMYRALPFPDIEPYRLLKVATEVFLTLHCGVDFDSRDTRSNKPRHYLVVREALEEGKKDSTF